MLRDRRDGHHATGVLGLGQLEITVGMTDGNGVTNVVPVRHRFPVGKHTAGGLRAALKQVAHQAASRQQVILVILPGVFVHQRAQCQRTVHAATRNHNVRTLIQSGLDGQSAQIGIGSQQRLGQSFAADRFLHAIGSELFNAGHQIVAQHDSHLQWDLVGGAKSFNRFLAGTRVDAAGVREHLDTAPCNFFQVRLEVGDKIWRKSCVRIFQSRLCQQRHRDLGQIIHHQVLDVCF